MRNAWFLALVVACGKTKAQPTEAPAPKHEEARVTIRGVVKIGPTDPRHKMTPVTIEGEDGTRCLASYQADELWKELDGKRIVAEAERYSPEGQAILVPHVRVEKWRVVAPASDDTLVDVGPKRAFRGKFGENPAPPNSKAALSTSPYFFDNAGNSYPIAHGTVGELGKPVEIEAPLVELSPLSAHVGGPHLWILP